MYEYEFVELKKRFFSFSNNPNGDHRNIIREKAEKGWRLVEIFSTKHDNTTGAPKSFELIFEREIKKD